MIFRLSRRLQLSGSNCSLRQTNRYGILGALLLAGTLLAQRPDSWTKDAVNAETPTASQSNESGTDALAKPIEEVWRIVFHNAKGKDVVLDCEVARSEKEKERGLMFRKFLGKNRGMIFVYNQPDLLNFWMQNTLIPLSIAYVHEKLFIASIHDMKPLSLDVVSSDIPVLYAIEANIGWFRNNHIYPGNRITIYKNPADYEVETKSKYRRAVPTP